MTYTFRPARRSSAPLIIGIAGGTGSGKTYSAMRLAKGMAGGQRFAVIDSENGRASFYADSFDFDTAQIAAPFTPAHYLAAIQAADRAGYPVIVVDSASHEYAGDGGVLDLQEAEFKRLGGGDNVKMLSWAMPKTEHKAMVYGLLQLKAHLILCFRAENKIEIAKDDRGLTVVREKRSLVGYHGWIPITEKSLPFELTTFLMLTADEPGKPKAITLREPHRAMFPSDTPISEASGSQLAAWASGAGSAAAPSAPAATTPTTATHTGAFTAVASKKAGSKAYYEMVVGREVFQVADPDLSAQALGLDAGDLICVTYRSEVKGSTTWRLVTAITAA
jgi:hypothetical protein